MKILGPKGIEAFEGRGISGETAARFGISIDDLRSRFDYRPETGIVVWKTGWMKGRQAGSLDRLGYRRIYVVHRQFYAGPICWALAHGVWPDGEVDHINRNKDDNRLANLRDCTRSENLRNRCYASSGVKGVYWDANSGKWRAKIGKVYLGLFKTVPDAAAAIARIEP